MVGLRLCFFFSITVLAINVRGPIVNLGVGIGLNDQIDYMEQSDAGIPVVSLPHRIKFGDVENHPITVISIELRYCTRLHRLWSF